MDSQTTLFQIGVRNSGHESGIPSVNNLLINNTDQRQSHLRLSSTVQRSSGKTQSRNHPFPKIILPSKPERLESIPDVGRIRPELAPQTFNRPNPIPVRSRLSTTLFPWLGEPFELPAVNDWLRRSENTWNAAHVHLQRAVRRTREQADRRRREGPEYAPGQWVWLSTRDLRLRLPSKKLSPRYVGPFKILRQITPV